MRRSAACSCASPRAAASLAARSAVTAARIIEVSAATPTNSCVASRLSVRELRTNGPEPSEVSQIVSAEVVSSAARRAARAEAERRPDQRREDHVGHVALRGDVGQAEQRDDQRCPFDDLPASSGARARVAHVSSGGRDDERARQVGEPPRAPDALGADRQGGRRRSRSRACRGRRRAPCRLRAQTIRTSTSLTRRPGRARAQADRAATAATTIATTVPSVWPSVDAERRRVVGGEQVADHDAPATGAGRRARGPRCRRPREARTRSRSVRARAVVRVREVEPDARGRVVRGGGHDERQQVAPVAQPLRHARRTPSHSASRADATPARHPSEGVRLAVPAGARAYETI